MNQDNVTDSQFDAPKLISSSATLDARKTVHSEDENRFEALFESQNANDRSGKFSLTRYGEYTRN